MKCLKVARIESILRFCHSVSSTVILSFWPSAILATSGIRAQAKRDNVHAAHFHLYATKSSAVTSMTSLCAAQTFILRVERREQVLHSSLQIEDATHVILEKGVLLTACLALLGCGLRIVFRFLHVFESLLLLCRVWSPCLPLFSMPVLWTTCTGRQDLSSRDSLKWSKFASNRQVRLIVFSLFATGPARVQVVYRGQVYAGTV